MWIWALIGCGSPDLVEAPAAAATPEPSVAPQTAPAKGPSHCSKDDKVWFQCGTKGDKVLSLCGDEAPTWLQYSFGPLGKPELVFPAERAGVEPFGFAHKAWVRSAADAVRFVNDDHVFLVVDKSCSGANGEGEMNNFQGVVVNKGGKEVARIHCADEPTGTPATLSEKLKAVGYFDEP